MPGDKRPTDDTAAGPAVAERKRRGAWYTPGDLVDSIVDAAIDGEWIERLGRRPVRVIDPACGDGRFLDAARRAIERLGGRAELTGIDIDASAVDEAHARLGAGEARLFVDDALAAEPAPWSDDRYDLVIGNPPFLSQMAAATTRGGSSALGGGPYADAAVEFLALAADVVDRDRGRVAFVLPQSVLSSRDAAAVRRRYDAMAEMRWSTWTADRRFDAHVITCALVFECRPDRPDGDGNWAHVVTSRQGIPPMPATPAADGTIGDRARANANFRDEYYGMIPAVGDHECGPPLITSGLIDPGRSRWGRRPIRFAKQRFAAPRVDLGRLDAKMRRWADDRLVPKVLVANQTRVLEAFCDVDGATLPGVPVVALYPHRAGDAARCWQVAAVLTSSFASAWVWHHRAGSGMSAGAVRVGPTLLTALPWPAGDLDDAVAALRADDPIGCGAAVGRAYGLTDAAAGDLDEWWQPIVERLIADPLPPGASGTTGDGAPQRGHRSP